MNSVRSLSSRWLLGMTIILLFSPVVHAEGILYSLKPKIALRKGPSQTSPLLQLLESNQSFLSFKVQDGWYEAMTLSGYRGYVPSSGVSDIWIKAHKKERTLFLMKGNTIQKTYKIALCPSNPDADKVKKGDCATPEGRFYICEMNAKPESQRYGARSMRLSYPNISHARNGLLQKIIDYRTYFKIVQDIHAGNIPNQKTGLGSSIRIHGGGGTKDWTLGCLAMEDADVVELYDKVSLGTRVDIYQSSRQELEMNKPDYLNKKILQGARRQLLNPALYTHHAISTTPKNFPLGDIAASEAVCTDIIIRALRHAGLDLQALMHEDITIHPERYRPAITSPSYRLDHRRTRNLFKYFSYHWQSIPLTNPKDPRKHYLPGDVVILDTNIPNGTPFDHIGIVDSTSDEQGFPTVINIWTVGYRTASMALLGKDYPKVVGHFRIGHWMEYQ